MVKKVINIGVEGNDASGDPIREAFNKVNENFNELYSAFGKGDGISITALEEGPDEVTANSILISNSLGTQYLSKTLEGTGGIEIINSDPTKIVINSASASLAADPTPSVSNHLDLTGFNIVRVANPNTGIAAAYNTTIDSFAINKGYADSRYVNIEGDIMTGKLSVPPGAQGAEVAQSQETLLRAGGLSNQMQGPLILERKIQNTDNPLIAATKEYVDLGSYTSQINLYVNVGGDDDQFDIPAELRGRSQAYGFKSVSAACRYAQTLIDESPFTVAVNVKDITFTNGQNISRAIQIVDAGAYYVLTISNDGQQTDPRDAFDIRPGQFIKGKTSGSIVKILEIVEGVIANTESYQVEYVNDIPMITTLGGEFLEFGNPVKDLQVTIFIESGNYYEHYPIRVPPNTSIVGDELRRVILRPKPGRSASWAIDTYFRRDPLFDVDLSVTDRIYGYHYLTDTSKSLYSGTIVNPGGFVNASSILLQNKEFIQEEVIGYVNTVWRGLQYDETKCRRDTGLIIKALEYDLLFNSNFNSITAARAYYRGTQAAAVLGSDKTATLEALDELQNLLFNLITRSSSRTKIANSIALMKSIIDTGLSAVPEYVWDPYSGRAEEFLDAKTILFNNRTFIQAEIVAYINKQISDNDNNPTSIWYNLNISGEACARDVGLIVDAVLYDITYGGNLQSREAASGYYLYGSNILGSEELAPTLEAYEQLKTLMYKIVVGETYQVFQTAVPRVGGIPSTALSGTTVQSLVEITRFALQNNGSLPAAVEPSLLSIDSNIIDDRNLISANTVSLQDSVITFLNNAFFIYNEDLCKRDVGLIVDALVFDLFYGDYYRSLEAGNSYFESASALIAITTQLNETRAAINHLGVIAQRILQKLPIVTSYQNAYPTSIRIPQIRNMTEVSEAGSVDAVEDLVQLMIDIIEQDSLYNPTKNNDELDVFLMNEATIIRNITCQQHGGFMCVLDPLGQILNKSPYVQTSSSFSKSINERIFAGGMFVDAFAGNVSAQITARIDDTTIEVDGLNIRLPNLPCAFYINGVRFLVDLISEYNEVTGTARIHINPRTPDDPEYTLIEDSTRLFLPSTSFEFLSAGNNSMLCNDYTQLNDLGYGLVAVNGGLLEAVGVFTYYNQISYFSDTGGQIRSVGGSSAHGSFALVAKDAYPLEIPDDIYILEDMVIGATVYSPFDHYYELEGTNITPLSIGDGATFDIIVSTSSYTVSLNAPGTDYTNGDQIILLGNVFGGIIGINDIIITVTSVSGPGPSGPIGTISFTGTIPENAPINQYFNRAEDIVIFIHELTTEYTLANSSELEVIFGNSPTRQIYRYLVNNAQEIVAAGDLPVPPNGKLYRVNLASGGLGAGATGIEEEIVDGTRITIRQNVSLLIYDINRETATRPSTALIMYEAPTYVNRVIAISNLSAKVGTFTWNVSLVTITSEAHQLTLTNYTNISGTNISGAGIGATFDIEHDGLNYTVTINSVGAGYAPTNEIRVLGTSVGGSTPANDIVITVGTVGGSGQISSFSYAGIPPEPQEIYLVFLAGTNGNPSRGYYNVLNVLDVDTFTVLSLVPTNIYSEGSVSWGFANGECEVQLKEPFRSIIMTTYYDSNEQQCQPFTTTVVRIFSSTNELSTLGTGNLTIDDKIIFTSSGGGILSGVEYYVHSVVNDEKFTISEIQGGSIKTMSDWPPTPDTPPIYGTTDIDGSDYYTWGVTGSKKIAIRDISTVDAERITSGLDTGFVMLVGWQGRVHQLTKYTPSEIAGNGYAVIELDYLDPLSLGLAEPVGLLEGGFEANPNLKAVLPKDSPGNVTIQISTVRCTGHDMLEVGTGSYASTNFPNIIFGRPDKDADSSAEVREIGKGRVFYASTDQDGNFKVGEFFKVDQGTGTVTFSSSIAISNLDGLGFKRGVAIAEFSVDDSFFDNATDTVPTEQAVRSYIDRRLGITHNGAVINPATGRLIPNALSGFMSLDGQLQMKANMNMGSYKIVNMLDPTTGSDAATKSYADTKLSLTGGTMIGYINLHAAPTMDMHAATKKYVDDLANAQDQLSELEDVTITGTPADNSILAYNTSVNRWVNGSQTGDVLFTLAGNIFTSAIQPGVIINSDISSSAAISQSKLELNLATTRAAAPTGSLGDKQAASGLASFDSASFNITDGFVSLKANGISLTNLPQIGADTVLGNSSASTATPSAVTFETVIQEGGGIYNSLFTTNGALVKTGTTTYSTVAYQSTYNESVAADKGTIVLRDSSNGGFAGSIINATTQFNISGNKVIGFSGTSPNQFVEFYSPQGNLFLDSRSGTTRVQGSWTLGTGATLEATYAADIAEYYQGDKVYDPGTVLMIGGDFDVTVAKGEGTTKVAGVVSTNAAYIMNGSCPGEKNLIALQGRVPCKVIGKVEKGDLMVVGIVSGVAMASTDPKPGSIIGKALENYNSDHVGVIEVMVGKH